MDLIWDKMWSVGVDKIDRQHKELFNRINLLVCSMKSAKGKEEMITTLNFLEEYVIRHFNDEEEIQKKNNYPNYEIQHKEHEIFKNNLKELRKSVRNYRRVYVICNKRTTENVILVAKTCNRIG